MLEITIPGGEFYNAETNRFSYTRDTKVQLEHSLLSISKWESKWKKPFLDGKRRTRPEFIDYVRCMSLTKNVDPKVYQNLTNENVAKIELYMDDTMSATVIREQGNQNRSREPITSELVYYWMTACQIPFECEKWHFNRLMTLIRLCNKKNEQAVPGKKTKQSDLYSKYRAMNEANRRKYNSRG